jgi:chromosomal replication initiator protein
MDDQYTLDDQPELLRLKTAFDRARRRIQAEMPKSQFEKFLKPLEPVATEGHLLIVAAPGRFVQEWVRDKYRKQLERFLEEEAGARFELVLEARLQERQAEDTPPVVSVAAAIADQSVERYRFDNFVVGESNVLAYNGAIKVAENPGEFCNPLFIYGDTGLGKTHLLWAIANQLKKAKGQKVLYMTAQEFAARFVEALDRGAVPAFRRTFESAAALLVDDVGFVDGKPKIQEELFHVFNALHQNRRQIVFCSDRAPKEHLRMEEKLRSRLDGGLVADVLPPDTETRAEIARRHGESEGARLEPDACDFLASHVPGNVRTLIGAVTTLLFYSSMKGRPADEELAREVVHKQFGRLEPAKPSAEAILKAVSAYYKVQPEELCSSSRKAWVTHARHVFIYLDKRILNESWKRMGDRLGGRDHSSIIHGHDKIEKLVAEDPDVADQVHALMKQLSFGH